MRHAKSDWDHPGLQDRQRPLSTRGRKAAPRVGSWMRETGLEPDLVLCSTAVRTRETLELLGDAIPSGTPVHFLDALYHASVHTLLEEIRNAPPEAKCLLVVGHNPGLHELIWRLPVPGSMPPDVLARLRLKLPTGSLAHFRAPDGGWGSVAQRSLEFVEWITPRELR